MLKRREYFIIFLILISDVLGFSIIIPFLPFLAAKYGASPLQISLIFTTFSLFQFFSSPVLGRISDYYGRKPLLILSQLSTFISFLVLAKATNIYIIFLSRAIDGLIGSNISIAESYISDITSKKDRSKAFGLSGAAFGIGFLIGPAIGGILAKDNFSYPAYAASFFSLVTLMLTIFLLKESLKHKKHIKLNIKSIMNDILSYNPIHFLVFKKYNNLKHLFLVFFFYNLSFIVFVTNFAVFVKLRYNYDVTNVGLILTYVGILSILIRGFVIGKLSEKFNEFKIISISLLFLFIAYIGFSQSRNVLVFMFFVTLFSASSGLIRPLIISNISKKVSEKLQGEILGTVESLSSLTQIIGPLLGGFVLNYFDNSYLTILSGLFIVFSLYFLIKYLRVYRY